MNTSGMFNGERFDLSQRKNNWDSRQSLHLCNNRGKPPTGVIHRNLDALYRVQKPSLKAAMKKSNTLQEFKPQNENYINTQDNSCKTFNTSSQNSSLNSASSPGFKLSYGHLQTPCFFPKPISLTKNCPNLKKSIYEEIATNTNTVSSGSESERNSITSSSNKVTSGIIDDGTYGSTSGRTLNLFSGPGNPSSSLYYNESISNLDFRARVPSFPPLFISPPPICFPTFQQFPTPFFVAKGKVTQDNSGAEYSHNPSLSFVPLKEDSSTPSSSVRKYSSNSSHENSQMFKPLIHHRKSLPMEKGSAMNKSAYNKFNGTITSIRTSNAQAQSENTEILSIQIKLSTNRTEILKLRRFDNLYMTVKMFCESNNIPEHMIRPLCGTVAKTLNGIFTFFNSPLEKSDEDYLKSLNQLFKKKETSVAVHNSIIKLLRKNHGEEMLNAVPSLTIVDCYDNDECHSCRSFEGDDNIDDNEKLNNTV